MIIKPFQPVPFNEKAIQEVLDRSGCVVCDVKEDGVRGLLPLVPNEGRDMIFTSRSDKSIPALRGAFLDRQVELKKKLFNLKDSIYRETGMIIDCELEVKDVSFQESCGLLMRKEPLDLSRLKCTVFAVLPYKEVNELPSDTTIEITTLVMKYHVTLAVMMLKEAIPEVEWQEATTEMAYNMQDIHSIYDKVTNNHKEGLVIKDPFAYYKRGKRTGWWKMKREDMVDGCVRGYVYGSGKNEGKIVGFEVELEDGHNVSVTGLPEAMIDDVTNKVSIDDMHYIDWVCQISYMERTPDGSLRHPNWYCWRGLEGSEEVKA